VTMPTTPLTKPQRMTYRIGRGETSVLTFEPYKSEILPLWRFKTPSIARQSSSAIYSKFLEYDAANDFIGMDMSRKFLQMGMTRAKRYANHKGGRKYDQVTGAELEKSKGHEGMREKEEASLIFREVWERAKGDERYLRRKEEFQKEQKEWDKEQKRVKKEEGEEVEKLEEKSWTRVKKEGKDDDQEEVKVENAKRGSRTRVKKEIKEEELED
jgi:hypothetical protein